MPEKKRYVKIKSVAQGSSYIDEGININLLDLLDGSCSGEDEGYLVSIVEMTEDKFKALPEFTGF